MIRVHKYAEGSTYPYCKCVHCGELTSLDSWQIESMPLELAVCKSSNAPRLGIFGWLVWLATGSVDCYLRTKENHK